MPELSANLPVLAIIGTLILVILYLVKRLSALQNSSSQQSGGANLNVQMRRFAEMTMRLLGGAEVAAVCPEIVEVIVSSTDFPQVAIVLGDDQKRLHLSCQAGASADEATRMRNDLSQMTMDDCKDCCTAENRMGGNAYRKPATVAGAAHPWPVGGGILVPICSGRGTFLGMIILSGARDMNAITAEDLTGIELLASHMAFSIENTELQMRAFQSEKLKGMGQLVAGVAHELNNPLTAVLGYTEILSEKTSDLSIQRDLGVMRREALRMKRIIESLQQFSRKQKVEQEKVRLDRLLDEAIAARNDELVEQKIEVVRQIDPSLPEIIANYSLIEQVFDNVFSNAMEAVQDAHLRRILIEARALGGQVHIQVSDTGPGFKDVGRVFDPFYTTKAPGKGTGLGLSLCYGIIRDHGGAITASNLHPLGACVSIQLPMSALHSGPKPKPPAPSPTLG